MTSHPWWPLHGAWASHRHDSLRGARPITFPPQPTFQETGSGSWQPPRLGIIIVSQSSSHRVKPDSKWRDTDCLWVRGLAAIFNLSQMCGKSSDRKVEGSISRPREQAEWTESGGEPCIYLLPVWSTRHMFGIGSKVGLSPTVEHFKSWLQVVPVWNHEPSSPHWKQGNWFSHSAFLISSFSSI